MIYTSRWILPIDGDPIEQGEIVISDGKIAWVGRGFAADHPNEPVRDLGDCAVLPGFVNAHAHLDYTLSRPASDALNLWDWIPQVGFSKSNPPSDGFVRASATIGAARCAQSGVTCIGDSSYTGLSSVAIGAVGLRGIVYREFFGQSWGEAYSERFREKLDQAIEAGSRAAGLVKVGLSPHSIYSTNREVLELCAEYCAELCIPIAIHAAETRAETQCSRYGTGPIADMRRGFGFEPMVVGATPIRFLGEVGLLREGVSLAHCVHVDECEVELIASSGAGVAHCPRSNANLGCGVAPLSELAAAGAVIGLGTDSAASAGNLDFFQEMRFALAVHRAARQDAGALTAKKVVEMATVGGAEALGLADQIGTLSAGKRADIIAVRLGEDAFCPDPYLAVLSRSPGDVETVLVDGVEIARAGCVHGVDLAEVERQAQSRYGAK